MTGSGGYEYEEFNEDGTPVERPEVEEEIGPGIAARPPMPELPKEPVAAAANAPAPPAPAPAKADREDDEEEVVAQKPEPTKKERAGTTGGKAGPPPSANGALRKRKLFVAALLVFCGFLGWTVVTNDKANKDDAAVIRSPSVGARAALKPLDTEAQAEPAPAAATPERGEKATPQEEDGSAALLDAAQRAPMMAFGKGEGRKATQVAAAPSASDPSLDALMAAGQEAPADAGENEARRFDNRLKPTVLEGSKAGVLGNRNLIIAMGASIPCTLETAIATDQPGFTSCIVSRDILSDNGRVVLLDKGTQIVGEYRGGLQRGQKRLFVLWTRAKTPTGVIVQLASPATDALGRAGFGGYVDTHWWERFGSALLLSMVGDLTAYGLNQIDSESISVENTAESGKDAAAIAVEQSINIPPTLRKHQGELVSIFVARDLDFSGVYRLKPTERQTRVFDRAVLGNFSPDRAGVHK